MAKLINSLETIIKALHWMVEPVYKRWCLHNDSWPLNITIKSTQLSGANLIITMLVSPREPTNLGKCTLLNLPEGDESSPLFPLEANSLLFQEWRFVDSLTKAKTFRLGFYMPDIESGHKVKIYIESQGYICKSNAFQINSA